MPEGLHAYVDESAQRDYLSSSPACPQAGWQNSEEKGLLMPRQRSIHMKDETRHPRRVQILDTIVKLNPGVRVYSACPSDHGGHTKARAACLEKLAMDSVRLGVQRMVLDRNDTVEQRDKSAIITGATAAGAHRVPFQYAHLPRHSESLVWIPDAVGWSWAKGGEWRSRVAQLVTCITL